MVADIMEQAGWEIKFTGADTPAPDLMDMLKNFMPDILGISVTMPFNIDKVQNIIREIRKNEEFSSIKIMVGGKSFNENPELWSIVGADALATSPLEAEQIASSLI